MQSEREEGGGERKGLHKLTTLGLAEIMCVALVKRTVLLLNII
jgi:hypothetical protein